MATGHDWTADELIAELKRRERRGAAAPARARGLEPRGHRDLSEIPSGELARLAQDRQRGIYGVDDRRDLYQVTDARVKKVADAVVAIVERKDLTATARGGWTLATTSYQDEYALCSSEPFASQPLGCFCSGFLVRPDVIATAGHCVKTPADLEHVRFVFGFRMLNRSGARTTFGKDDVYTGAEIVGREFTEDKTDWALVRLDRPVVGRTPVAIRTSGKVSNTQKLFVVGHPCGLPLKYAGGAAVRANDSKAFFVANLDTYGGNSGSPVFSATTRKVEGILVRGDNDFVKSGPCYISMVCPTTGCRGEDVTRASEWVGKLPATGKRRR